MILLCIFLFVSYKLARNVWADCCWEFSDVLPSVLLNIFLLLLTIIVFLSISFLGGFFCSIKQNSIKYETYKTYKIYSSNYNTSPEGSFFLGIGSIKTSQNYYYFVKSEFGYRRKRMPEGAYNVSIKLSNDSPKLEFLTPVFRHKFIYNVIGFVPPNNDLAVFYVPKGSIKFNFKM